MKYIVTMIRQSWKNYRNCREWSGGRWSVPSKYQRLKFAIGLLGYNHRHWRALQRTMK